MTQVRLKIFRAATVPDAIARVRGELGPDAMIVSTRPVRPGVVEVTATLEQPVAPAPPTGLPPTGLRPAGMRPAGMRPAGMRPVPKRPAARSWRPPKLEVAATTIAQAHGLPESLSRLLAVPPLSNAIAQAFRFAPIAPEAGPILFVGPPGAGKTSTVARLATRMVLTGAHPLVVTCDGRRAGATDQLAAYTRLLKLNLVAAPHRQALARAVANTDTRQPVLIDSAGADCRDPAQMEELRALAQAVGARPALVLPAGLDAEEATDIARAFAALGASLLVATRLDLARRLGSILTAGHACGYSFAEAGIGPGAADGLRPMTPALLADRLEVKIPR
jgi:flagellar biosynthesis protein FlhF